MAKNLLAGVGDKINASNKKKQENSLLAAAGNVGNALNKSNTTNTNKNTNANAYKGTYPAGNYTIGSDDGKSQAQNMGIGSMWTATDGSVWKKENDGTITVDYNGTTTRNAYVPTDLGINLTQMMEAGVPRQYVENAYYKRYDKANDPNHPELKQFATDGIMQQAWKYILDKQREEYQPQDFSYNVAQPTYEDKYNPQIEAMLNQILNRDDFSYNAADDPLYQQYAAMYQREGDRAMRETMAEAAASAGGMNSYAVTAAQQANNYYNAQLNDRIPELYQLAYEMYLGEMNADIEKMGLLQDMSDSQYNRYLNTMDMWYKDRDFAYGKYQDDVANGQWRQQFDYNAMWDDKEFNYGVNRDNVSDQRYDNEWNKTQEELAYEKEQAEKTDAYNRVMDMIGGRVPFEAIGTDLIAKAGLTDAQVKALIANKQNGKGSGGSSRKSGTEVVPVGNEGSSNWTKIASDLGLPASVSQDYLADLYEKGAIILDGNEAYWANGWDKEKQGGTTLLPGFNFSK